MHRYPYSPARRVHSLVEFPTSPADLLNLTRRTFSRLGDITTAFPVSVERTQDGFELQAELPGISKDEIDISLLDHELSIRVNQFKTSAPDREMLLNERVKLESETIRRFHINDALDANSLKAHLKDGILTIILKNKEKVEARKIEIHESAPDVSTQHVNID